MSRPSSKPSKLRDGFYIDVRSKGAKTGVKIRKETLEEMNKAARQYGKTKEVIVMGEYKNGKPIKKAK